MAETVTIPSYPYDDQDTTETQYSTLFRELQEPGLVGRPGSGAGLVTAPGIGMDLDVAQFTALGVGRIAETLGNTQVTVRPNTSTQSRVDRVVVCLDVGANAAFLTTREGTPGSSTPGALIRTLTGRYDIPLALVTVPGGSPVNIPAGNVTDDRRWVSGRVELWTSATRPNPPRDWTLGLNVTTGRAEAYGAGEWLDVVTIPRTAVRDATGRRETTNTIPEGTMSVGALVSASLPASAPAGLWEVTFTLIMSSTADGTATMRGLWQRPDGTEANLTNETQWGVRLPTPLTLTTTYEHTGGAATLRLLGQVNTSGTPSVHAGSRITARWLGPARG